MRGVTLVLGGGGVRGFAHVGVLSVLERERMRVERIVGTSVGAVVGLAYARAPDAKVLFDRGMEFARSWPLSPVAVSIAKITRSLFHPGKRLASALRGLFDGATFDDLIIPAAAVAVDLHTGSVATFTSGLLWKAAYASAAIPGVFAPHADGTFAYVDGGVLALVPVKQARELGSRRVVAVDVGPDLGPMRADPSQTEVLERARRIVEREQTSAALGSADEVLRPAVGSITWDEFGRAGECYEAGAAAAAQALPSLRRLASMWRWLPRRRMV